jgi:solute carrier family 13 (sodium-dependent dicarboxylate transporter), member 2/3/5
VSSATGIRIAPELPEGNRPTGWLGRSGYASQILVVAAPLAVWLIPLRVDPKTHGALAIVAFMLLAWMTEAIDFTLAGLIGCFLFWVAKVAGLDQAFSGFVDSTSWFMFAAVTIGLMGEKTVLPRVLSNWVIRRVGLTYSRILLGLIITNFLLTFVVPSGIARLVILAPICEGLLQSFGAPRGSNTARGMFLIVSYTSVLFDKFIVSGATSITGRGMMERFGGVHISWSEWFAAFAPIDVLTVLACWGITLWLLPPEKTGVPGGEHYLENQSAESLRWRPLDTRACILMGSAVLLWMTDFLHGLNPAAVALGVAFIALLPRIGVLSADDLKRGNFMPFYFVAAALSMGTVVTNTGAISYMTDAMFGWMNPAMSESMRITVLYWSACAYHLLLASEISMMSTSVPPLMKFATINHLDPKVLGLVWIFASGGKIFVYQSAVTAIGYSYGYFKASDLLKLGLILTFVVFLFLIVLTRFYWPLIGIG